MTYRTVALTSLLVLLGCGGGAVSGGAGGTADGGAGGAASEGTDGGGSGSCDGMSCSGHGTCVEFAGAPACVCDQGYESLGAQCLPTTQPMGSEAGTAVNPEAGTAIGPDGGLAANPDAAPSEGGGQGPNRLPDGAVPNPVGAVCAAGTVNDLPSISFKNPPARAVWPQELRTFEAMLVAEVKARLDETVVADTASKLGKARSAVRKAVLDFDDGGAALAQGVSNLTSDRHAALNKVLETANAYLASFEQAATKQLTAHDQTCKNSVNSVLATFDKITESILSLEGLAGSDKEAVQNRLAALRLKIDQQVRPLCTASSETERAAYFGDYTAVVASLRGDLDPSRDGSMAKGMQAEYDVAVGEVRTRRDSLVTCARSLLEKLPPIPDLATDNAALHSAALDSYTLSIANKLNDWYWDNLCTSSSGQKRTAVSAAAPCGENETLRPQDEIAARLAKLAAVTALPESQHQSLRDQLTRSWTTFVNPVSVVSPFNEGVRALVHHEGSPTSSGERALKDFLAYLKSSELDLSPDTGARNVRVYDSLDYLKHGSLDMSPDPAARNVRLYDSLNYIEANFLDMEPDAAARDVRLYDALNYLKNGSLDMSPDPAARNVRLYDSLNYLKGSLLDLTPDASARNVRLYDCIGVTLKQTIPDVASCLEITARVEETLTSVLERYTATRARVQEETKELVGLRDLGEKWSTIADAMYTKIERFSDFQVASYGANAPNNLYMKGLAASLPLRNGTTIELRSSCVQRWVSDGSVWLGELFTAQGL